jgi:hypothetical protein
MYNDSPFTFLFKSNSISSSVSKKSSRPVDVLYFIISFDDTFEVISTLLPSVFGVIIIPSVVRLKSSVTDLSPNKLLKSGVNPSIGVPFFNT